ncbi:MAG: tetratricopeptide repeat protein [Bacteroidota bacterium]|nr:tetratricopeptide repeat protein [Bacteroidota bacterium]
MKKRRRKYFSFRMLFFLCLLFLSKGHLFSQKNSKTDSLKAELQKEPSFKKQIPIKLGLYQELINEGKGDSILKELLNLEQLAEQNELNSETGDICIELGNYFLDEDSYDKALAYFEKANKLFISLNNKKQEALSNGRIAAVYLYLGEYQKSLDKNQLAVSYYLKENNPKSLAACYGNMGIAYKRLGKFIEAIEYQNRSFNEEKKINNKKGMASCLNAIGNIHFSHGDYPLALKHYFESLKIQEEAKYKLGVANALSNIGLVFKKQGEYQKALDYSVKSLKVEKEMNSKQGIAISLANIGDIYFRMNDFSHAKEEFANALTIFVEIKDEIGIADVYASYGLLFESNKQLDSAIYYHQKALTIYVKNEQLEIQSVQYYNMANCLANLGKVNEAISNCERSLKIAYQIESLENIELAEELLSQLYEKKGQPLLALKHFRTYMIYKDSIFNIEKSKALTRNEIKFEYEKKASEDSLKNLHEQELKDEQIRIHQLQISQEKTKNYALYGGIIILVVFGVFIFNRFKVSQKQNKIIEKQKLEVENQKRIVEEHQKEITDSINYAKRIQSSFLASGSEFKERLNDHFIFFKPKDLVSGDFYWANYVDGKFYLCVADSTGHGIPGAFMSLLNISLLNESLLSRGLTSTKEILNFVRKILILGLKPDESGQGGNDGMDCTLISIDLKNMSLEYTGANNPLWIVRNSELLEFSADKMPVGRSPKQDLSFTSSTIDLRSGDVIYLFTDGYADQFGGPKGKKFKYKQLSDLFLSINLLPLEEQEKKVSRKFEEWKNLLEQVDDVCIIGLRI